MNVVKMLDGRRKMADVCPLLLLTSDFAETTSVSIGCYGYRPYMFGCIDHVGVKQIQPLFILAGIIRSTMTKDASI